MDKNIITIVGICGIIIIGFYTTYQIGKINGQYKEKRNILSILQNVPRTSMIEEIIDSLVKKWE